MRIGSFGIGNKKKAGAGAGASAARGQAANAGHQGLIPTMPRASWGVDMPYPVPDRWYTFGSMAQIGAASVSSPYTLSFRAKGLVLGWNGCAKFLDRTAQGTAMSSLKLRLLWNASEEMITNGEGGDYALFNNIFREGFPYSPLMVLVTREDKCTVTVANDSAATPYTPDIALAFLDEETMMRRGIRGLHAR